MRRIPRLTGVRFFDALLSACRRAYFLLLRQKKVAKEKATPGCAVGYADSPALLDAPGGCGTRGCAPQTVLADCPRPVCVARRSTRGPGKASRHDRQGEKMLCCGRPPKKAQNAERRLNADGSLGPLGGAEQRRIVGGLRLALSEPRSGEFSQPPNNPSSTGHPAKPGADPGSPSSLLTFFLARQEESKTPVNGGIQRIKKSDPPVRRENQASQKPSSQKTNAKSTTNPLHPIASPQ